MTALLAKHEIVVGVSGGIASYKTAMLVSRLVQAGAGVTVAMSRAARNFIGPPTIRCVDWPTVATRTFDTANFPLGAHIQLAERAELFVVAPATANFLSQAANGAADDLLATMYLCMRCPVLLARP